MIDLPGYEVVRPLGRGGMGAVFLARQLSVGREVVIKQLLSARGAGAGAVARFRQEARILARLNHPHIVQIYSLETLGLDVFLVMEYVRGPTLKELMAGRRLGPGEVVRVVMDLADALDYAWRAGIVHRDMKPANVLVTEAGRSKLADFGVAKMLSEGALVRTQPGAVLGTPVYISPEVASAQPRIDQRADIYSLGVMTYEMLVGRVPFEGEVYTVLEAHVYSPPPAPRLTDPGFPAPVEAVLMRALAKDPGRRPGSAGEFAGALGSAVLAGYGAGGTPVALAAPPRDAPKGGREAASEPTLALRSTLPDPAPGGGPGAPEPTLPVPAEGRASAAPARLPELAEVRGSVYRPPARRRPPGSTIAAAAAVLIALVAAGVGLYSRLGPPTGGGARPPALAVTQVAVSVDAPGGVGHCPQATFNFRGEIRTNGSAGAVSYQWVRPDGQLTPADRVVLTPPSSQVVETLAFTYQGNGTAGGSAALHVLSPADVYSAPVSVSYVCP